MNSCSFTDNTNSGTSNVEIHTKPKFWLLCCDSEAILFKKFRPGHWAGVFIWENFHSGYRDPGCKNRDLGKWASPASCMNTSINIQRKEWVGEISETEPTQSTGLIHV